MGFDGLRTSSRCPREPLIVMEGRLPGAAANHLHPGVNAEVAFTTLRDWAVAAGEKRMMGERVAETAKYTRPGQYRKLSLGPAALVEAGGMAQRGRREALRECMMAGVTEPPWRSRFYLASRKVRNKSIASFQASTRHVRFAPNC